MRPIGGGYTPHRYRLTCGFSAVPSARVPSGDVERADEWRIGWYIYAERGKGRNQK